MDLGWQNYHQHNPRVKRSLNGALMQSSSSLSPQQAVQNSRLSTDHGHGFAPDSSAVVETTDRVDGAPVPLPANDTLRKGKAGSEYEGAVNQGEKQFETEELEESSSDEWDEGRKNSGRVNRDLVVIKASRRRAEEDKGEDYYFRPGRTTDASNEEKNARVNSVMFEQEELSSDEDD